jgi:hypothetical protein
LIEPKAKTLPNVPNKCSTFGAISLNIKYLVVFFSLFLCWETTVFVGKDLVFVGKDLVFVGMLGTLGTLGTFLTVSEPLSKKDFFVFAVQMMIY